MATGRGRGPGRGCGTSHVSDLPSEGDGIRPPCRSLSSCRSACSVTRSTGCWSRSSRNKLKAIEASGGWQGRLRPPADPHRCSDVACHAPRSRIIAGLWHAETLTTDGRVAGVIWLTIVFCTDVPLATGKRFRSGSGTRLNRHRQLRIEHPRNRAPTLIQGLICSL